MRKTNVKVNFTCLSLIAVLILTSTSCSKSSNVSNKENAPNEIAGSSPTAVFKAYYDAAAKRDFVMAKKYLSQGTLKLIEEEAKRHGKMVDEAFKDSPAPQGRMPELTNEQINGDTATVDAVAEGQKVAIPFVKEGGEWKIAMDKLLAEKPSGSAVIVFSREGKTTSTITFDESEMRELEARIEYGNSEAALDYVSNKMELLGLKCCEPRKRIDECIWQCCDKNTVSTCNKTLQAVLEKSARGETPERFQK